MPNDKIKQIKVGASTYDIEPYNTAVLASSHIIDALGYTPLNPAGLSNIITLEDNSTATAGTWLAKTSKISAYTDGQVFLYRIKVAGASTTTLNINSLGAKTIYRSSTSKLTTQYPVGQWLLLYYSTNNSGCFFVVNDYASDSNTIPAAYCTTAAATAAKVATHSDYALLANSYELVTIKTTNTAARVLTLNINNKGAKPIYINGTVSSASNYNLLAGTYLVFYDGTNYYFNTDGKVKGLVSSSGDTMNGNLIMNESGIKFVNNYDDVGTIEYNRGNTALDIEGLGVNIKSTSTFIDISAGMGINMTADMSENVVIDGTIIPKNTTLATTIISTTWSNLINLRSSNQLVPGQQYRITDYTCTTTQFDTQSAGHQFDIIVTADDVNKLNENARAIKHSGDTYFTNAGSKLESWELKYCLDNDTSRFAWADTENGTGIIYYLKDEFNNECPYDFKNIQFKRYTVIDVTDTGILSDLDGQYLGFIGEMQSLEISNGATDFIWCYTFYNIDETNNVIDISLNPFPPIGSEYSFKAGITDNIIKSVYRQYSEEEEELTSVQYLNNIVINEQFDSANRCCQGNIFESECLNMSFLSGCFGNIFNYDNMSFIAGINFRQNKIRAGCSSSTFGNHCDGNTFGNHCYSNTFGNYCDGNTFGNHCYYNTFGDGCIGNTFGATCSDNTFGANCSDNTFGANCDHNTFGNHCGFNTFGNYCDYNTFGDFCDSNTFGNRCSSNTLVSLGNIGYAQYNIFENGVQYVDLKASTSGFWSSCLQNITIRQGIAGTYSTPKVITETRELTHDVTYRAIGAEDKAI